MKTEWVFPYRKEPSDILGLIDRPVVEVHLRTKAGNWLSAIAYADSGADFTLFPKSVCKLLGLRLRLGRKSLIGGISGSALSVFIHTVEMRTFIRNCFFVWIGNAGNAVKVSTHG